MPAHPGSGQPRRDRDGRGHGCDVVGRYQPAGMLGDEFGDPSAREGNDRGAARHGFGDHESVRLVPRRGDQSSAGRPHESGQFVLPEMSGIPHLLVEVRLDVFGEIARV